MAPCNRFMIPVQNVGQGTGTPECGPGYRQIHQNMGQGTDTPECGPGYSYCCCCDAVDPLLLQYCLGTKSVDVFYDCSVCSWIINKGQGCYKKCHNNIICSSLMKNVTRLKWKYWKIELFEKSISKFFWIHCCSAGALQCKLKKSWKKSSLALSLSLSEKQSRDKNVCLLG